MLPGYLPGSLASAGVSRIPPKGNPSRSFARPAELQCGTSPVPESPTGRLVQFQTRAALREWRILPTHSADLLRAGATPPWCSRRHV
ncbi:hypothetical protein NDU88_004387 [Pleurodeles waltl]|uniref:Uncharacterized protein n=1 Tax=Pleurodeles waltl TaxID=8319 RepID=A0AAV7PGI6_PLEWA|nr:hypothetical protein NDU88_004387 [Pleurodeles waltl]